MSTFWMLNINSMSWENFQGLFVKQKTHQKYSILIIWCHNRAIKKSCKFPLNTEVVFLETSWPGRSSPAQEGLTSLKVMTPPWNQDRCSSSSSDIEKFLAMLCWGVLSILGELCPNPVGRTSGEADCLPCSAVAFVICLTPCSKSEACRLRDDGVLRNVSTRISKDGSSWQTSSRILLLCFRNDIWESFSRQEPKRCWTCISDDSKDLRSSAISRSLDRPSSRSVDSASSSRLIIASACSCTVLSKSWNRW